MNLFNLTEVEEYVKELQDVKVGDKVTITETTDCNYVGNVYEVGENYLKTNLLECSWNGHHMKYALGTKGMHYFGLIKKLIIH